jgi:uncharacterized Ntn-hydrolase superfamily protein
MTFSLVGRCERTEMVGVAVTSSSPAVAARCAYVRAGVGAAASQNITDPRLGVRLLDLMEAGSSASEAVTAVVGSEPLVEYRQLAAVDVAGRTAVHSGAHTLGRHATAEAPGAAAAGNLLSSDAVVTAMANAFAAAPDEHLAARLVRALEAGLAAGGEEGPVRSAGVLVAHEVPWPVCDLRVDWHDEPIAELRRLWEVWATQLDDYVTRALDPASAPAFGVPGDPATEQ